MSQVTGPIYCNNLYNTSLRNSEGISQGIDLVSNSFCFSEVIINTEDVLTKKYMKSQKLKIKFLYKTNRHLVLYHVASKFLNINVILSDIK